MSSPIHKHKILFLDVDGVLNRCGHTKERISGYPITGVEPGKCELLRRILVETGCMVVLSSTWRKHPKYLPYLWQEIGLEFKSRWLDDTPVLEQQSGRMWIARERGHEIAAWLNANKFTRVTKFLILDDGDDMAHLMPHLLRTHSFVGLTPELTEQAIERLNSQVTLPDVVA